MNRVKPLADICPIYETPGSEIPDAIRVPMDDGHVLTYRLDRMDAARQDFEAAMAILRKWNAEAEVVGYQYQPKHAKKTARSAIRTAAQK